MMTLLCLSLALNLMLAWWRHELYVERGQLASRNHALEETIDYLETELDASKKLCGKKIAQINEAAHLLEQLRHSLDFGPNHERVHNAARIFSDAKVYGLVDEEPIEVTMRNAIGVIPMREPSPVLFELLESQRQALDLSRITGITPAMLSAQASERVTEEFERRAAKILDDAPKKELPDGK